MNRSWCDNWKDREKAKAEASKGQGYKSKKSFTRTRGGKQKVIGLLNDEGRGAARSNKILI